MTPPQRLGELDGLGVRVHMLDETAALGRIGKIHDLGPPRFVSYVNPHTVNLASRDRAFAATLARADTRLADGFGIRIAARRQGVRVPAILNGSDFNVAVLRRAAAQSWPVFLLGGQSRVAERAAERVSERIAGLRVVGTHHGLFTDAESDAIVDHVRASQASVLMVALGQPRQDEPRRPGMDVPTRAGAATPGPSIPRRQPGVPRSRTAPRRRQRHADLSSWCGRS